MPSSAISQFDVIFCCQKSEHCLKSYRTFRNFTQGTVWMWYRNAVLVRLPFWICACLRSMLFDQLRLHYFHARVHNKCDSHIKLSNQAWPACIRTAVQWFINSPESKRMNQKICFFFINLQFAIKTKLKKKLLNRLVKKAKFF